MRAYTYGICAIVTLLSTGCATQARTATAVDEIRRDLGVVDEWASHMMTADSDDDEVVESEDRVSDDSDENLRQQVAELQAQLQELRERQAVPVETEEDDDEAEQAEPAPAVRRPVAPPVPVAAVPMMSPFMDSAPVQRHGRRNRPHPVSGCESGPLALEIRNELSAASRDAVQYFVRVVIDGQGVDTTSGSGVWSVIPPGQSDWICLDSVGGHSIEGVVYMRRGDFAVPTDAFGYSFSNPTDRRRMYGGNGHHHLLPVTHGLVQGRARTLVDREPIPIVELLPR